MSDELTTDEVIDDLQGSLSEGDDNDFTSFEDADINDAHLDSEESEDGVKKEDLEAPEEDAPKEDKIDDKEDIKPIKETTETKTITVSHDGKDVELSPDTVFKQKVDGKEVDVTLQELLNKDSGEKAISQRFSDLDVERKTVASEKITFENERDDLTTKVQGFVDAVNNQNADLAIQSLAALTGSNPVQLRNHFKDLMINQVVAYQQLTPEQQKDFDIQQEREYYAQEREYQNQQNEIQTSSAELENQIVKVMTKHGISDQGIVDLYDEAKAKSVELNSAEDIERYHLDKLTHTESSSILSKVDPSLVNEEKNIQIVTDYMKENPELSEKEVIEFITEVTNEMKEQEQANSISSKAQARGKKNNQNKSSTNAKKVDFKSDDDDELLTFDDVGSY